MTFVTNRRSVLIGGAATALVGVAGTRANAATKIVLAMTGASSPTDWPLVIARAKNYFTDAGIDLEVAHTQSSALALQQLVASSAQIATSSFSDTLRAMDKGAKVNFIRMTIQYPPYTLWAKPGIKTFEDLRKKTVIIGGAKDITRFYLERMLVPNNLKTGDYELVYAGTTPARFAALMAGAVDVAILLPPFSFQAEAAGFSMIARLSDYVKDLPFGVIATSIDWGKANKATVVNFLDAYQRGMDFFYDDANKAECIELMLKVFNANKETVEKTYDYYRSISLFAPKGFVDAQAIGAGVKMLAEDGELSSGDPARYIDPEIASLKAKSV